jgi:FkbM family methyltransferase
MDRLNATLVGKDALVFDIGAHVGDRTDSFARLGATVVALEPQPKVFRALRLILGRRSGIILRNEAVGAVRGSVKMYINSANPTVSTASKDLIAAAGSAETWQGENWDTTALVPVTTLDLLIAEFGQPDFVKIDVEGFEFEVLRGLTTQLPALSFEFTTIQRDMAVACIDYIATLGDYTFNYSLGEEHSLRHDSWVTVEDMRATLCKLPQSSNSGDIFVLRA